MFLRAHFSTNKPLYLGCGDIDWSFIDMIHNTIDPREKCCRETNGVKDVDIKSSIVPVNLKYSHSFPSKTLI